MLSFFINLLGASGINAGIDWYWYRLVSMFKYERRRTTSPETKALGETKPKVTEGPLGVFHVFTFSRLEYWVTGVVSILFSLWLVLLALLECQF